MPTATKTNPQFATQTARDLPVVQPQIGLTLQDVWAALMETRARQEEFSEQQRKTDEQQRKTDEQILKTEAQVQKTSREVDRLSKNVGGLNLSMGTLVETLIAAKLWEKFANFPYNFRQAQQRVKLYEGRTSEVLTDIDILLLNDKYAMAVEVKAHLNQKSDIDHHLKRMELILKYPPGDCKGKIMLGAMAGGAVDKDVRDYAHSVGFFVLELTGDAVTLARRPTGFKPREW
jgi:predicted RNase H-like nuclease (RuvC/YqgF family)